MSDYNCFVKNNTVYILDYISSEASTEFIPDFESLVSAVSKKKKKPEY